MIKILFICHGRSFSFCLNFLILCGFSQDNGVRYNDFTTFEKCSDMIEMGDSTKYLCISCFFIHII